MLKENLRLLFVIVLLLLDINKVFASQTSAYTLVNTQQLGPQAATKYPTLKWQTVSLDPGDIHIKESNTQAGLNYELDVKLKNIPSSVDRGRFAFGLEAVLDLPQVKGQLFDEVKVRVSAVSGATVSDTSVDLEAGHSDTWQGPVTLRDSKLGEIELTGDTAQFQVYVTWISSGGNATWEGGMTWTYRKAPAQPEEKLPIIFIPGVAGSQLDDNHGLVISNQLWPLKWEPMADRRDLALDKSGTQSRVPILAKDVIRKVLTEPFYAPLISELESWGYKEGDYLAVFPYDWRLDNRSHAAALDKLVNEIRMRTGKQKVILLTHSMGGLLARYYLTHGGASKVAKHIAISGPNLGSAKVYWAYIMGYTFGNIFVNPNLMKWLFPNLPAGYQLMPFNPFISEESDGHIWPLEQTFSPSYRSVTLKSLGIIDDWEIGSTWDWNFNDLLEKQARDFQQSLGSSPASGVEMHSIMGWGIPTVSKFIAYRPDVTRKGSRGGAVRMPDGSIYNFMPVFETGDETVPLSSLEGIQGDAKYYIRNVENSSGEHTGIVSNPLTGRIVRGILEGKIHGAGDIPDASLASPNSIQRDTPDGPLGFMILCPANLHVYDAANHHDGLVPEGYYQELIPSSSFLQGDDEQVAAIANPSGPYHVRIEATGDGVLTLIVWIGSSPGSRSIRYADVPIHKGDILTLEVASPSEALEHPAKLHVTSSGGSADYAPSGVAPGPEHPKPTEPAGSTVASSIAGSSTPGWTQTLVYHQVTSLTSDDALQIDNGQEPRMSANGNRIVLSMRPAKGDPARRSRVAVVDAGGTNLQVVDTSDVPPMLDISADGNTVVSAGGELRTVKIGETPRLLLYDPEMGTVRMRADGQVAYFCQNRDYVRQDTKERLERGIYAINVDGTGLHKIVGATAICQLLGVPADKLVTLSSPTRGSSFDVSRDGNHVVFLANVPAQGAQSEVFTVDGDGSNLKMIAGATLFVGCVGISGDGSRIAWTSLMEHAPHYGGWTSTFSGSEQQKLSDYPGEGRSITLTDDGSWAVFGMEAVLYSTDGKQQILVAPLRNGPSKGWFYEPRLQALTMSRDGTRLSYAMDNSASYQMAMIERAPTSFGNAPAITEISMKPNAVPPDPSVLLTVRARVQSQFPILGGLVSAIFLCDGKPDGTIGWSAGLRDDAQAAGDEHPGDGIFTDAGIHATKDTPKGARRLRIKAEVTSPDGRSHATIIEVDPSALK